MFNKNINWVAVILLIVAVSLGLWFFNNQPKNQNLPQREPGINAESSEREKATERFSKAYFNFQTIISSDISEEVKAPYLKPWLEINKFSTKNAFIQEIEQKADWLEKSKNSLLNEWGSFQNSKTQKEAGILLEEIQNWESVYSFNPDQKGDLVDLRTNLENLIKKTKEPTQTLEPEFKKNKEQLEALKKSKAELQSGLKKPEPIVQKSVQNPVPAPTSSRTTGEREESVQNSTPPAISRKEEVVQKPPVEVEVEVPKKPVQPIQQKSTQKKETPKTEEKPIQPIGDSTVCNGEYKCFVGDSSAGKVHHYVNGKKIWTSGVATFGRDSFPTEKGMHRIYLKIRNYQLPSFPDYTSSYWIGFNPSGDGSAFHQYWGANDNRLTVGCVKLPEKDLAYIWSNSSVYENSANPGTLVIII